MIAPHDVKTIEYVNAITSLDQIRFEADKSLIQAIGKDIDEQYLADIHKLSLGPQAAPDSRSCSTRCASGASTT